LLKHAFPSSLGIDIGRGIKIMKKITTWQRVAVVIFFVSLIAACGQKGDLYLPEGNALIAWMGW